MFMFVLEKGLFLDCFIFLDNYFMEHCKSLEKHNNVQE